MKNWIEESNFDPTDTSSIAESTIYDSSVTDTDSEAFNLGKFE